MPITRTAASIKGQTAVWGVETAYQSLQSGIVRSVTRKKTGERDYLYDYEGFTIAQVFFDEKEEVELEVVCKSDTAAPTNGDTLAIGTVNFLVQDSQVMWEQRGWKKLKTTATYFPNLTLA
jgi:hypothetical protein